MADTDLPELSAFLETQLSGLRALGAWLIARTHALSKATGFKVTRSFLHYALYLLPGPWMLIWAWSQPEYNASKKMVMKLPASLGGDPLPSFISNPFELGLVYQAGLLGLFSVVELVGLVLSLLCCRSATVGKEEGKEEGPPAKGYTLTGLVYLCMAQAASLFCIFCTDAPVKDFSAKYSLLPGVTFLPNSYPAAVHLGLVLLCLMSFLRYTVFGLGGQVPKPNHGALMLILFAAGLPFLIAGDSITHLASQFK